MRYYLVIFISLLLTNFFGLTTIGSSILLGIIFPFVLLQIQNKSIFKVYIILVFIGLSMSIISCNINRGQSLFLTFKSTAPYYYILFYFMLKYFKLSIPKMEKAIIILVSTFCICYIIQYLVYPKVIFSGAEAIYEDEIRIRLAGQGFSSLGYFFGINKFIRNNKNTKYLILSILCFIIVFLMGFRTMLIMIFIFTFILIIRVNGFSWKLFWYSLLISGIFFSILQVPILSDKIDNMLDRQKDQTFTNIDYIRVIQFNYFTQEHFKNVWECIAGSGVPTLDIGKNSHYSNYMQDLLNKGINWVDLGLISISWIIGVVTVIAMIGYSIKAFFLKVPAAYYYLGIWFMYMVICSFTTSEFYRSGNFIVQALVLYLVERVHNKFNHQKKNKTK